MRNRCLTGNGPKGRQGLRQGLCRRAAALFFCGFLAIAALSSCGDENGAKVVFTTGMGQDEVFRIGSGVCTVPEMMVYLTNTQNQYESVYGQEVWNISVGGVTMEENVKDTVLAKLAQIKTMYLLAQDRGVALDEAEAGRVQQAAAEYFGSLSRREAELMGVEEKTIEKLYEEYALADKVYRYIIQDVNPEISDDEARTITVQQIVLRTKAADAEDGTAAISEAEKAAVYERACDIRHMAVDGEHDFVDLASRYSDDSVTTFSFGIGEKEEAFERAAFALATGEVSQVIETEEGYHIIKCISTFDKNQTDVNKLEILEQRRREVFGEEYDAFVETLARQLNTEVWQEMTLPKDERVTTADFFEVYRKHFPDTAQAD